MSLVMDRSPVAADESTSPAMAIHLRDVSYTYPQSGKLALQAIDCTFRTGTTAIVGPNGAGKSTLVKLLTGLLTPTAGSIRVQLPGGASVSPAAIHKAVLFQEPSHLYLTIRQNITMRFERTPDEDARIADALEIAGLANAVKKLPDGIDTLVGAGFGGRVDLSGGQWQRLGLARLIYQDAPVMILDEPIASLDPEGERAVFELFCQRMQGKIIIFTTHRYDSIPRDTKIVVLVDGRITETGTHEELLGRQRDYWSLYMSATSYPQSRVSPAPCHPDPERSEGEGSATPTPLTSRGSFVVPSQDDTAHLNAWDAVKPKTPHWKITHMSELDRDDLELMEAIRKSGIKVTSIATKNIAAHLVGD